MSQYVEEAANINQAHPRREPLNLLSQLWNLSRAAYHPTVQASGGLLPDHHGAYGADPYYQDAEDIDTFTPQEVLQATRLIRLLKQSIWNSQSRQPPRQHKPNEASLPAEKAFFGPNEMDAHPRLNGRLEKSPKRGDAFGWSQDLQLPASWEQGQFEALIAGMKAVDGASGALRHANNTVARVSSPRTHGQMTPYREQSLGTKQPSDSLGIAAGTRLGMNISKEATHAVASYPQPRNGAGEVADFSASRGTFEQPMPQRTPSAEKLLAGSQGSLGATLPVQANGGDEPQEIQECPYCHRTFTGKSFEKHVNVCVKVFFTRRKQYDMTRKRLANVMEETGLPVYSTLQKLRGAMSSKPLERPTEKKWQRESAQFRAAMRMARACDPREIAEAQAIFAKCSDMGANKQCQHCGRTFGRDEALEKHEGVCQRMFKNGGGVLRKGGGLCAAQGAACRVMRNAVLKKRGQSCMDFPAPRRNIDPSSWGYQQRSTSHNSGAFTSHPSLMANGKKNNAHRLKHHS